MDNEILSIILGQLVGSIIGFSPLIVYVIVQIVRDRRK